MGEGWGTETENLREVYIGDAYNFFNTSGGFQREKKLIKQDQVFCRLKGDIIVVFNIRSVASTGIISVRFVPER